MKSAVHRLVALVLAGSMLAACGATANMIAAKSRSERGDVFREIGRTEAIPVGYADVIIRASLKTHLAGYYVGESKSSPHGKPTAAFLVNIDGQAALWNVSGARQAAPPYPAGAGKRDAEAGEGMKYVLEKRVRLAEGSHRVFFGLPGEPYYTTAAIDVNDGGVYVLEFRPQYRYSARPSRHPSFLYGISRYDVLFGEIAARHHASSQQQA